MLFPGRELRSYAGMARASRRVCKGRTQAWLEQACVQRCPSSSAVFYPLLCHFLSRLSRLSLAGVSLYQCFWQHTITRKAYPLERSTARASTMRAATASPDSFPGGTMVLHKTNTHVTLHVAQKCVQSLNHSRPPVNLLFPLS